MNSLPDTRVSLILRLPGGGDLEAWQEFVDTYEPFVFRFARRRGLQDADARELVQEVFLGVAKAVSRWQPDESRARFRTWLFRIAKNQLVTLTSRRPSLPAADSAALDLVPDPERLQDEEQAYRQEVFRWASQRVRGSVQPTTWNAFWETSVAGRPVAEVADQLGLSRGQIYVARSRIISKLRAEIQRFESEVL